MKTVNFIPRPYKDTFDKIDNVFVKELESFNKYSVDDFGDRYRDDKSIKRSLKTHNSNEAAKNNPDFDPINLGVNGYTRLGDHAWLELVQRITPLTSLRRIVAHFRFSSFTVVYNVKHPWLDYVITVDGLTHLIALYLHLREGNIKGWNKDNWREFPVPTYTWHTEDKSFPIRIALEINGGTQLKWEDVEHLRCHSTIARLFPQYAKPEDELALKQVMACLNEGRSVPKSSTHPDAKKYREVITHIGAVRSANNKDIQRLKYILGNNYKYFGSERRDSGMFGFFGNIYDKKPNISDEQLDAYCYIIQHCGGMKKTRIMARDGIKKLVKMSNDNWKVTTSDDEVLALVEFLYKQKLNGTEKVTDSTAYYKFTDNNNVVTTLVDAIRKVPDKKYSKLIDSL